MPRSSSSGEYFATSNTKHRKKRYYRGEGVLVCSEEEERWLPSGNQRDDDNATDQKNQP
jgi:hypothetical protein